MKIILNGAQFKISVTKDGVPLRLGKLLGKKQLPSRTNLVLIKLSTPKLFLPEKLFPEEEKL